MVLTGEGCIDRSTLMGKGVGEIAARARSRGLACLAFGGVVRDRAVLARRFTRLHALAPDLVSLPEALEAPAHWLTVLAEQAAATSIREIFPR
jgi:glycerate kinase